MASGHTSRVVADTIRMTDLVTPRGRFQALVAGEVGAPPVLVLHGFPDVPTTFTPLLQALAAHGYRAVAPWMRGYAPSPLAGPFDVETLADDVAGLAELLEPRAAVRVIGHDWGAVATYAAAVRHPARIAAAVTLAVPHPMAFVGGLDAAQLARSWYMLFLQLPGAPSAARAGNSWLVDRLWRRWSPGYRLPPSWRAELERCLSASWPAPALYYRALLRPVSAALARIGRGSPARTPVEVPTLYLHGAEDGCIGVEMGADAQRWFGGPYEREIVAGAGHFLAAERPQEIADRAARWFALHGG